MKKKIAILATYVGCVNRGAETFVIELSKKLREEYEIDIYSTGQIDELKDNIIVVNIKKNFAFKIHEHFYNRIKLYRKICNYLYWIIPDILFQKQFTKKVFAEHIVKKQYDLIFPNNGFWGARYARIIRKKNNTPFIYTGHGGIGYGEKQILKEKPNYYIALTQNHGNWAKKYSDKIAVIHNGIDCDKFQRTKNNKIANNEKLVIVVAELTKFKQHKLTIDAVALLENYSLLFLGRGELYDELCSYGNKKLGNRFKIMAVRYNEIKAYYEKADVFTLPSINEPFGIVYLEAMAMGLPIVAPEDETRREIVENAGILCDCHKSREYADAIVFAANHDWQNIPREQSLKFDWQKISLKYKEIIEKAML